MSSPSLGGVSSALDISHGRVRRRVSGPYSIPSPHGETVTHSKVPGEACANPFDDVFQHNPFDGVAQPGFLPALGRELDDRPFPPVPTKYPDARLPTSKIGSDRLYAQPNDLLSKIAHPLRTIRGCSKPGEVNDSGLPVEPEVEYHNSKGAYPSTPFSESCSPTTIRLVPQQEDALLGIPNQGHDVPSMQPGSPALLAATHAATDRFTRRFPISISHRKANTVVSEEDKLLPLLGYGETGAVVEWPNVWTPEKWALLLSICSVS
ncbi:tetraspanin family protein [Rhizoctonia solani]|uniref:Tetraspanin family protein n=1 Tax=Rhizoctonia solani TaxID=456999 RepID=A0A8H8NWR7_9AGAM|nr:tetraspanin family protein [Rhizoctonia solani]QRW20137.1 tetraspanin family protein [Rhizoctonia solani]